MKKSLFAAIFIALLLIPGGVKAQEKSWFFDKWDTAIRINKDSTFLVQEAQTFNFTGDFSWVTRTLPKTKGIRFADISVYETDGTKLSNKEFDIEETDYDITITLHFDLSNTTHTWIFEYTVIGGLGFFGDYDELYWNVVSSDRAVRIDQAQATVYLPEPVEVEDIQQKIYRGSYYSDQETLEYTAGTEEANFFAQNIFPYENFTIVLGWPKGVVDYPGYLSVNSEPEGASVNIDGQPAYQKTPVDLLIGYDVLPGTRTLELKKFGYNTRTENIIVAKSEDQSLNYTLDEKNWYVVGRAVFFFLMYLYFASPLFVLLYLYLKWKKYGRDPGEKKTIIPQYDPPDNIKPAEMGTLIDEKADLHDITATIVDLAYRGYLRIYEEKGKSVFGRQTDYRFEKLKDYFGATDLKEYERMILKGMFEGKKEIKLSDLKNKFYKLLKEIKSSLYKDVTALGYFEANPEKIRHKYFVVGIIFIALGWVLLLVPAIWGILILLFGVFMPKKTVKGVEAKWYADGFKMYLHTAERFRLGKMTPETFEKFLAYAMVFKVEKEWAERFKDIYTEPPDWYVGSSGLRTFAVASFASNLSSGFNSAVAAGLSSSPSSSSGFGGGGGAGGGGGGGGSGAG